MISEKLRDSIPLKNEKVMVEHGNVEKIVNKPNEKSASENKINKELSRFSKNLSIITIISALLNLMLIGIVVLIINNLVNNSINEQYKQLYKERKAFTAFMEKQSPTTVSNKSNNNHKIYDKYNNKYNSNLNNNAIIPNKGDVMPLHLLYNAPISNLENIDSIIFEFEEVDENNKGKIYQNMYHVKSISREIPILDEYKVESEAILKFYLSDNSTLILRKEKAILTDKYGNEIYQVMFNNDNGFVNSSNNSEIHKEKYQVDRLLRMEKQINTDINNSNSYKQELYKNQSGYYGDDFDKRKLISSNSHKHTASHSLKTQSAYMAAVCKYGCGEMGVTYPYYYRPFFGYGFPLLGTEPYFQSGYGGNVETAMNNNMFNPESSIPRPPGVQGTPSTSPFSMNENPYNYPYSASPGGGYYYYYVYPNPNLINNQEIYDPNYYYEENYQYRPDLNSTEIQ
ncbi:hypothetical protein RS030_162522 [Cryptosporidium xiaoi]|uniref:Uncharacterized protein n=1 Tax=Cryptosporidium xiaoi TaxID=659607 RepID=A0AAV9Y044_9CRYT